MTVPRGIKIFFTMDYLTSSKSLRLSRTDLGIIPIRYLASFWKQRRVSTLCEVLSKVQEQVLHKEFCILSYHLVACQHVFYLRYSKYCSSYISLGGCATPMHRARTPVPFPVHGWHRPVQEYLPLPHQDELGLCHWWQVGGGLGNRAREKVPLLLLDPLLPLMNRFLPLAETMRLVQNSGVVQGDGTNNQLLVIPSPSTTLGPV